MSCWNPPSRLQGEGEGKSSAWASMYCNAHTIQASHSSLARQQFVSSIYSARRLLYMLPVHTVFPYLTNPLSGVLIRQSHASKVGEGVVGGSQMILLRST
jgi:hypothetical protein